jgi:succinate dehydrogenase / fumarate reductase membrane anchor subunit
MAVVEGKSVEGRTVKVKQNYDTVAWKWMRYSGILLIPLAWLHVAIQDVIVGVHAIDLDYVQMRWASLGWRAFDFALLAFAFAHGMNGLRQVLDDYIHGERARRNIAWLLLIVWLVISLIGGIAIIGGVQNPEA